VNNSPKIKKILEHYHNRQFDEAENLALMMTIELHDHPIPWQVLGAIYSQTGRKSEAVDANLKALQISPENPQAHNNYGITLQELGRFDEAEKSFKKSIQLKYDFFEAYNNLGITLKELGRFDEAEKSFKKSILLKPDFAGAHNNLGNLLKKLKRFDEAETRFKQAILLNDNNAGAHNNLGNLLKDKGDLLAAINSFKKAIDIQPENPEPWNNIFFPLQASKPTTLSIEKQISTLSENKNSKYIQIAKSILNYRLNMGTSSIENYLNQTIKAMSSDDNIFIKNPQITSNDLIKENDMPKKITALVHFGRSGTGLLHSLIDEHPEVSTLPSIYFSEFFDRSTWKKIIASGWEEMAERFAKIYEVLFDASSSTKIASKGMRMIDNIGQKEGMTSVGAQRNEIVSIDKEIFINELNYQMGFHHSLDAFTFFKLIHFAYEKTINSQNKKNHIFYHIHNPDTYAQLNFLRLSPNTNWLMMVREPLQSCESWIKKDFERNNYKNIVNKIFEMLFDIDQPIFRNKNSIGVKLEDLKEHPKKTIPTLCNWLEIKEKDSLYQMTMQGKKWWGDPTSPDYTKDGMDPFSKTSINRKIGSIFSKSDQFILHTLFYPFSVRFGYAEENLDKFKNDLIKIRPLLNQMFDFEKKVARDRNINPEKFMKSGSYLYLRSGMIERWNTLKKLNTYPNMIKPLKLS